MALPDALVIRKSQMRALGLGALESYLERLAEHVAEVFPGHAAFVRGRRGRPFLRRCLAAAARHGLRDRHSVTLYTDLAVALGEDLSHQGQHRWLREILDNPQVSATAKIYLIYKSLPERCPGAPLPPPPGIDEGEEDEHVAPAALPPLVRLWRAGDWGQ